MPDVTFNTVPGRTINRDLDVACLNTGTTANPIWDPIGRRVQDSSFGTAAKDASTGAITFTPQ